MSSSAAAAKADEQVGAGDAGEFHRLLNRLRGNVWSDAGVARGVQRAEQLLDVPEDVRLEGERRPGDDQHAPPA